MKNVPIQLLNAFVVFNDSRNIMEAAAQLGITQPALSKQLRLLEEKLPVPLFTLSGRKKSLTPFGRDLYKRMKERIGDIQELVSQTTMLCSSSEHAKIRIAGRRGVLDRISGKIRKFDGSLFFVEASNDLIIEALLNLDAEIGITHRVPNTSELVAKPLFKEKFQIILPKSFISQQVVFGEALLAQLSQLPCIGYRPEDEILKAVFSYGSAAKKELRMIRATENYSSIVEMVDAKLGWAVVPSYLRTLETRTWTVLIPAKALPSRQFFVIYRPEFTSVGWFKDLVIDIRSCFELGA